MRTTSPGGIASPFGVTMVIDIAKGIVAIGGAEDRAALRKDAGNIVPVQPLAFATHKPAKRVVKAEHAHAVVVHGSFGNAANDGIEPGSIAPACQQPDSVNSLHERECGTAREA